MVDIDADQLETVAEAVMAAEHILFITGAGMSAESGLPTYRGIGGLYNGQTTEDDIPIETALSGTMLRQRPDLTWKYLAQIADACRGKQCNPAHRFIANLEAWRPGVWTLTQNVDGFHRAAGSRQLIEIHGDMHQLDCMQCGREHSATTLKPQQLPPRCSCQGVLRPRVVLFGEMLPVNAVAAYEAVTGRDPELIFSIGTTSVFPYIAAPVIEARQRGATVVEINPGDSEVSTLVSYRWRCPAVMACQALAVALSARGAPDLMNSSRSPPINVNGFTVR